MHFWIDKRSQEYGLQGRRRAQLLVLPPPGAAASSSSGSCSVAGARLARGRRRHKPPMVTPVHRFQPIESLREELQQRSRGGGAGGLHGRRRRSRSREGAHRERERGRAASRSEPEAAAEQASSTNGLVVHAPAGLSPETSVYLSVPSEDGGTSRRASSSVSSPRYGYAPAASPASMAFLPMGRLKCVMWACFALLTVLVASAKFYLDHYRAGFELLGLGLVLLLFLLVGCTVSFFRLKTRRYLVSRVAGDDLTGEGAGGTGTGTGGTAGPLHHRLLLLPPSTSPLPTNRFYRPQRLTLRPVRVSRSQPNMQELPTGAAAAAAAAAAAGAQEAAGPDSGGGSRAEAGQLAAPGAGAAGGMSTSLAMRRSHSTYSQQTMSSLSPSEGGWSDGAPPPYHVAILLPAPPPPLLEPPVHRQASSETPPPSYEKAIS